MLSSRPLSASGVVAGGLIVLTAAAALAQGVAPAPPTPPPAEISPASAAGPDEASARIIERLAQFYQKLPGVSVKATMQDSTREGEGRHTQEHLLTIIAGDPNRFAFRPIERDGGDATPEILFACDGEKLHLYLGAPLNKYATTTAPATYAALTSEMLLGWPKVDVETLAQVPPALVAALLDGEQFRRVLSAVEVRFMGRENLEGVACERLRLTGTSLDVDLWSRAEGDPWIARVTVDYTRLYREMLEQDGERPFDPDDVPTFGVTFAQWEAKNEFAPDAFAFTPPPGAEQVGSLAKALEEFLKAAEGPDPAMELVGQPAPAFELPLLEGGTATLAAHKGRDIVVLDFWATWCGPCVRGLPVLVKVTDEFKDKNVVFYAINQGEEPQIVRDFLTKRELRVRVPLDRDQKVGELFRVQGIPRTVIIDTRGIIQAVHVGFWPDIESRLREELAALVAGRSLLPDTEPADADDSTHPRPKP